jgi:predicted Rdx family selenoprotein
LEIEADLVVGHGGIFEVAVDGVVVAKKTWAGFPDEATCVREVARAVGRVSNA